MNQVIKAFLGIYLLMAMTIVTLGILGAFLTNGKAQNLQSAITAELESSHFDSTVVADCFQAAEEQGCTLSLRFIDRQGYCYTAASVAGIPSDTKNLAEAEIVLQYVIEIPVLGIRSPQTLCSVAR